VKKQTPQRDKEADAIAVSPAEWLRGVFLDRKAKNGAYSTRAFARDIGMSQSLLSRVMSGKRPLTLKQITGIAILLNLGPEETQRLQENTLYWLPKNAKVSRMLREKMRKNGSAAGPLKPFFDYDEEIFRTIAQWYHYAILELSETQNFKDDPNWIARRLGISPVEALDARNRLLSIGLLRKTESRILKTHHKFYVQTKRSTQAIRSFHKKSFKKRDISGITLSVNPKQLAEVRKRIEKFQSELVDLLAQGKCTEVYQLNVQLFPLTQESQEKSQ
jgi:uncharacterized protein (TIGR02147 family)